MGWFSFHWGFGIIRVWVHYEEGDAKRVRQTRTHCAGGVAGGVMLSSIAGVLHSVRYSINATLSTRFDPSDS